MQAVRHIHNLHGQVQIVEFANTVAHVVRESLGRAARFVVVQDSGDAVN